MVIEKLRGQEIGSSRLPVIDHIGNYFQKGRRENWVNISGRLHTKAEDPGERLECITYDNY